MTDTDAPGEQSDGRRAKGERRRRAIIDATLRVVERDGIAGVSHRNIAREAEIPPASITYYFDSIDGVLVATLLESCETMISELRRSTEDAADDPERWVAATAEMLSGMVRNHRGGRWPSTSSTCWRPVVRRCGPPHGAGWRSPLATSTASGTGTPVPCRRCSPPSTVC